MLILILLTSLSSFELKPIEVPSGMSCSQLYDKIIYYVKIQTMNLVMVKFGFKVFIINNQ